MEAIDTNDVIVVLARRHVAVTCDCDDERKHADDVTLR